MVAPPTSFINMNYGWIKFPQLSLCFQGSLKQEGLVAELEL